MHNIENKYVILISLFIFLLVQLSLAFTGYIDIGGGHLYDPDAYMRLNRVFELHQSGQWHDLTIERSNAPFGEVVHWTRPLDVLLLAGAWALSPFIGFEQALFWWGALLSPILGLAAVASLFWAAKPMMMSNGFSYLGLLFICQLGVLRDFFIGRPDHHGLMVLLFVLFLGLTLRLLSRPFKASLCYLAALVGAVAIWISVEFLVPVFISLAVLGVMWVKSGEDFSRKFAHFSLGLFAGVTLALVVEEPVKALGVQAFDRISIAHAGLFAGVAAVCGLLSWTTGFRPMRNRRLNRLVAAGGGVMALLIFISLGFPKFFAGPFVDIDPRVLTSYMNYIGDGQPLIASIESWPASLSWLGTAYVAVPFMLFILWRRPAGRDLRNWAYLLAALAVFMALTLGYQKRWVSYAEVLLVIPGAEFLAVLLAWIGPRMVPVIAGVARVFLVVAFSVGISVSGMALQRSMDKTDISGTAGAVEREKRCRLSGISRFLTELTGPENAPKRILSHLSYGAELVYRTPHEVVSSGYHRNARGILDTVAIFSAPNDKLALDRLRQRKVNLILVCPGLDEALLYVSEAGKTTFYDRLRRNRPPEWLHRVGLPDEPESGFLLFKVIDP